jgi:hypothetical protein
LGTWATTLALTLRDRQIQGSEHQYCAGKHCGDARAHIIHLSHSHVDPTLQRAGSEIVPILFPKTFVARATLGHPGARCACFSTARRRHEGLCHKNP